MFITGDALEVKGNVMISVNSTHPFHNFFDCESWTGSQKELREETVPVWLFQKSPQEIVEEFRLSEISKICYVNF